MKAMTGIIFFICLLTGNIYAIYLLTGLRIFNHVFLQVFIVFLCKYKCKNQPWHPDMSLEKSETCNYRS